MIEAYQLAPDGKQLPAASAQSEELHAAKTQGAPRPEAGLGLPRRKL